MCAADDDSAGALATWLSITGICVVLYMLVQTLNILIKAQREFRQRAAGRKAQDAAEQALQAYAAEHGMCVEELEGCAASCDSSLPESLPDDEAMLGGIQEPESPTEEMLSLVTRRQHLPVPDTASQCIMDPTVADPDAAAAAGSAATPVAAAAASRAAAAPLLSRCTVGGDRGVP